MATKIRQNRNPRVENVITNEMKSTLEGFSSKLRGQRKESANLEINRNYPI